MLKLLAPARRGRKGHKTNRSLLAGFNRLFCGGADGSNHHAGCAADRALDKSLFAHGLNVAQIDHLAAAQHW
jgi:hypothetical protein